MEAVGGERGPDPVLRAQAQVARRAEVDEEHRCGGPRRPRLARDRDPRPAWGGRGEGHAADVARPRRPHPRPVAGKGADGERGLGPQDDGEDDVPAPDVGAPARHLKGAGHGEHGREDPERERRLCHVHGRAPTL